MASRSQDSRSDSGRFTQAEIKELIKLVGDTGVEEVEVEEGDFRLRIVGRSSPQQVIAAPAPVPAQPLAQGEHPAAAPAVAHEVKEAPVEKDDDAHLEKVTSPMVGTFYRSPAPDSPSFIQVGDRVTPDSVLCIIEAMKLMNEIKAETSGVVRKAYVENGQPVEYGQPLFAIEPA
jgi:acetyl-CoA carboxylase biotin carboxyl carrier protein